MINYEKIINENITRIVRQEKGLGIQLNTVQIETIAELLADEIKNEIEEKLDEKFSNICDYISNTLEL